MNELVEGRWWQQLNLRLDPQAKRELRALSARSGQQYSELIRRLIHEEYQRRADGMPDAVPPRQPAGEE